MFLCCQAQEGVILALEDADLLLLDGNVYSSILTTGAQSKLGIKKDLAQLQAGHPFSYMHNCGYWPRLHEAVRLAAAACLTVRP
jgi:hypothetical protein